MSIIVGNLTVGCQSRPTVHHVSAEFADQSMWTVFGLNEVGKSALLRAVMGLQKVNTGYVRRIGPKRGDIAYLPQQSKTDRSQPMTVFGLAAMGLWYEIGFFGRVSAGQRQRVFNALERMEIADSTERQITYLSNGQFQHMLFAWMLVQDAEFLLLDGPFNAVDVRTTYTLLEVLVAYHTEERAVITVLHGHEQIRIYFANTLSLAHEKITAGAMKAVLIEEHLRRADAAIQRHGSANWCGA